MMIFTIVAVTTFDKKDRKIFGYMALTVESDSMAATDFAAGDVIFIKDVDPAELKVGDIIAFISQNPVSFGDTVTHKIRNLTTDENGDAGFITYGTTTGTSDEDIVTYDFVLGKYVGHIAKVGYFFDFLKSTPGYIVCILVPFVALIVLQVVNCIQIFRRYKKEQTEQLEAERAKLEEERAESKRMMEELQELRAQLERQQVRTRSEPESVEKQYGDISSENQGQ